MFRVGICAVVGYQVANLAVTTHVHSFFGSSIVTSICYNLCFIVFLVFSTVRHSIDLFHQPSLMHNFSLFTNNMFVTLLSSTCFEH